MLNLTFGEQVKIVLSRKGMTIKELAQLIEEGTGKKMSRQNLTQRLSRDNFQEQDMRMIAEILECPLYLSILEDGTGSEVISNNTNKKIEDSKIEDTVRVSDAPVSAVSEPAIMVEAADDQPMENERDITIGELVEIHEELDAMAREAEAAAEAEAQAAEVEAQAAEVEAQATEAAEEAEVQTEEAAAVEEETADVQMAQGESDSTVAETEAEEAEMEVADELSVEAEENAEAEAVAAEQNSYMYEETASDTEPEYTYGNEELYTESDYTYTEEQPAEEPVENIQEEVQAVEEEPQKKEEAPVEKAHGWRSYLKFRRKKEEPQKKQEPVKVPETPAEAPSDDQAYAYAEAANYEGEAYEQEYTQNYGQEYDEAAYEQGYTYAEAPEEMEPAQMYADAEEDRERGEVNPYTGREYESNSVRMHPKRIGYVQVYDRTEHKWTDMTEWAFLGYQERKKALLGKDYVPPIYLD